MTFEQVLVKYLYQHRQLSLQGIGVITLSQNPPDAEFIQKNKHLPIEGISFMDDPRTGIDDGFVSYFSEQRGKIKSLAISDIESHLQLARQMINIGNPYEMPGIGAITKQKDGKLILHPGYYVIPTGVLDPQAGKLRERFSEEEEKDEESSTGISKNTRGTLIALLAVLVLGLGGWLIWKKMKTPAAETAVIAADSNTAVPSSTPIDSLTTPAQQATPVAVNPPADSTTSYNWKAYFRSFANKTTALEKMKLYKTYTTPVYMETSDSVNFKAYVLVKSTLADTASKRDSLGRFYGAPVKLERTQ